MFEEINFTYTPEQTKKIKALRALVDGDHELAIGTEDILLSKFLYFTSWEVKKAFKAIHRYYDFKYKNPAYVAQHSVQYFHDHFLSTGRISVLHKPDKKGRVVVVCKAIDAFDHFPNYLQDMIETEDLVMEGLMMLPQVQKHGITIIYDLNGVTKNLLKWASPMNAKMVFAKNEVTPYTERVVHLVQNGFLSATINMVMGLMGKEYKKQIFTHLNNKYDKLREMVGYENLPAEYGGPKDNEPDVNFLYDFLESNSEYLHKLQTYRRKTRIN